MRESVKKIAKLVGILTLVVITTLTGIYFIQTRTVAGSREYIVVTEDYVSDTKTEIVTDETEEVTENTETNEAVTEVMEETVTEAATEKVTEVTTEIVTEDVTTEIVTEEPTTEEPTTEESTTEETTSQIVQETAQIIETDAPVIEIPATEAATETVAVPVVEEKVEVVPAVTYTDVVYKDAYNTYKYSTLEEAKANINVNTLTDEQAKEKAANNKTAYSGQVNELVSMINAYRSANGLKELSYNDNLTNAAMHRAAESAYADWNMTAKENGTKRHIRPNFEKASSIGAEYGITGNFGENYGRYHASTTEILEGWQNSGAHNALLLSDKYTSVGIGIAKDSAGYFYWIAIFN